MSLLFSLPSFSCYIKSEFIWIILEQEKYNFQITSSLIEINKDGNLEDQTVNIGIRFINQEGQQTTFNLTLQFYIVIVSSSTFPMR